MKTANGLLTFILVLVMSALTFSQTSAGAQSTNQSSPNQPSASQGTTSGQPGQTQQPPRQSPPQNPQTNPQNSPQPNAQQNPQTGQQPGTASQPAQPQGKRQPQAKSQPEYTAYQQADALTDPVALEAAANDFAAKYPDSELRAALYQKTMLLYQNANNAERTIESGRKVLQLDADNPVVLVTVASVISERTHETDLDRDERLNEAAKDAQKAIQSMDTGLMIPPGTPPERVQAAKSMLLSMAYAALGNVDMNRNNYPSAEVNLRKAADLSQGQPDAVIYLRLAVVLDHEKKYPEALTVANKAVEAAPAGSPAANLARQERDRLIKLTGGTVPPAPAAATPGAGGNTGTTPGAGTANPPGSSSGNTKPQPPPPPKPK